MAGIIYSIALLIVALVCAAGVLYHRYDDNLLQRIGMSVICIGAIGEIFSKSLLASHTNAGLLLAIGLASFAVGSCWRYRPWRSERRRSTDQRITNFCNSFQDTNTQ